MKKTAAIILILLMPAIAHAGIFSPDTFDLGVIDEDNSTGIELKVINTSNIALSIKNVETSCGCTVVKAPKDVIPPGGSVKLLMDIDVRGKMGPISKTITLHANELALPHVITLNGKVEHFSGGIVDTSVVFRGDCASCHVGQNIDKKSGVDLYNSVCFMCHRQRLTKEAAASPELADIIANGIPGTSMPAFSKPKGGPLTDVQIQGLAEFVRKFFGKK